MASRGSGLQIPEPPIQITNRVGRQIACRCTMRGCLANSLGTATGPKGGSERARTTRNHPKPVPESLALPLAHNTAYLGPFNLRGNLRQTTHFDHPAWNGRPKKALESPCGSEQVVRGHYFDGFWGLSKSENGGCFPSTHHLEGDSDHSKLMRPGCGARDSPRSFRLSNCFQPRGDRMDRPPSPSSPTVGKAAVRSAARVSCGMSRV